MDFLKSIKIAGKKAHLVNETAKQKYTNNYHFMSKENSYLRETKCS